MVQLETKSLFFRSLVWSCTRSSSQVLKFSAELFSRTRITIIAGLESLMWQKILEKRI